MSMNEFLTREVVCDVIQRYYAKKALGNEEYRFPRNLYNSIAREMRMDVSLVELIIAQNVR